MVLIHYCAYQTHFIFEHLVWMTNIHNAHNLPCDYTEYTLKAPTKSHCAVNCFFDN